MLSSSSSSSSTRAVCGGGDEKLEVELRVLAVRAACLVAGYASGVGLA